MIAALLLALAAPAAAPDPAQDRIARIMAKTDGQTKATAYKVRSVSDEYEIVARLGYKPQEQSLILGDDGGAYDQLVVIEPKSGAHLELWFDISSFFGKEF